MEPKRPVSPPAESPAGPLPPGQWADRACLLALLAASTVFFWPVLFGGETFYFRDTLLYYYPQSLLTGQAWREGRIPLWEPRIGAGFPYLADPHSAVFYPLTALVALCPMPRGYDLFTAAHLPLMGLPFFVLMRRWGLGRSAALMGAGLLMFSGFTVSTLSLNVIRAQAWMPLTMLAFEGFLRTGGRGALAATALLLAVQSLGCDPQHVGFTLLLLALQGGLGSSRPDTGTTGRWKRALLGAAAAGAFSFVLAAVQILPMLELFSQSARNAGVSRQERTHYQLSPSQLLHSILPLPFPDPAMLPFRGSFPGGVPPLYQDIYWGPIALAFALAAFGWRVRERGVATTAAPSRRAVRDTPPPAPSLGRLALLSAGLATLGLLLAVGDNLPFFELFTTVFFPLRVFRYPAKYLMLTAIALAMMAAAGADGMARGQAASTTLFRRALLAAGGFFALCLVLVRTVGPSLAATFLGEWSAEQPWLVEHLADQWFLSLTGGAGLVLACLAAHHAAERREALRGPVVASLAAIALLELALATRQSCPSAPDCYVQDTPATARILRRDAGPTLPPRFVARPPARFLVLGEDPSSYLKLQLGRQLMTQLRGVPHGCNALLASPALRLGSSAVLSQWFQTATGEIWDRLAAAAGAAYSLEIEPPKGGQPPDLIGRVGPLTVRKLAGALPRAFVATSAVSQPPVSTPPWPEPMLALGDTALFELPAGEPPRALAPTAVRSCVVEGYGADSLTVRFDLEGRGLLVVLDQYYPGWVASVDGRERPIHRVAGLFRGVEVAAGEHLLRMEYRPLSFRAGAAISVAALALLAAWVFLPRRRTPV